MVVRISPEHGCGDKPTSFREPAVLNLFVTGTAIFNESPIYLKTSASNVIMVYNNFKGQIFKKPMLLDMLCL